jgi:hypothetical protein
MSVLWDRLRGSSDLSGCRSCTGGSGLNGILHTSRSGSATTSNMNSSSTSTLVFSSRNSTICASSNSSGSTNTFGSISNAMSTRT